MRSRNVRKNLRRAFEEVEDACERNSEVRGQLEGIGEQLRYAAEGRSLDPEASFALERGAFDTIQRRITEVIAECDDEDVVQRLRRAREQLLLSIVTLDEQWKRQHEVPSGDE